VVPTTETLLARQVVRLYRQDPTLGFYMVRLITLD
jgi:hypothetical protein